MTRVEHLFTILMEEAAEVVKEGAKCNRFSPPEIYPEIGISNARRVMVELNDLLAVVEMLQAEGQLPYLTRVEEKDMRAAKVDKVEKHLIYSLKCGTLQETTK